MFYQMQIDFKPEEVLDYLRKSQSDDPLLTVEEVLQKHETILDEWAEKHLGAKVPEENKFREIVSGETLKERPEINKVLRLIESPRYKAVKVVEPQRLTRGDLEDIGRIMKLLKHTNTVVITPERIYNLRDEYDWNAFEAELKRGNDYLKYIKKIMSRGTLASVSQGNYVGSIAPYGYEKITVPDGKRKCPTLKIKEDEANVVRMIFDMYVNENLGYRNIANRLDELKIKPPKGKHWSPNALKGLLVNVHYIGKVKWNWCKTVTIVEEGEIKKTRPRSNIGEYLIYDGKHPAIISEEIFNAAVAKLGKNPKTPATKTLSNPFAGLVFCNCGKAMILRTHRNKGVETASPRMLCPDQTKCNNGSCTASEFTDKVVQILNECIADFEIRVNGDNKNAQKLHANLIKDLEKKLEDLNKKELSMWDKYTDEKMPKHIFDKLNEELLNERDEIEKGLCKAKESMPDPIDYEERLQRFKDALAALQDPTASADKKNKLLKECIERIEYSRKKAQRTKGSTKKVEGTNLPLNAGWSGTPFELDVKLKV